MSTAGITVQQVSLRPAEVADLANYCYRLPLTHGENSWRAISPMTVATWNRRAQFSVVSHCEAKLRNVINLAIPRHARCGWPGAAWPHELRHLVPTFNASTMRISLNCTSYEHIGPPELAKRWNVPVSWVRDHTRSRTPLDEQIPHVKLGRYTVFRWGHPDLEAWLERHAKGSRENKNDRGKRPGL